MTQYRNCLHTGHRTRNFHHKGNNCGGSHKKDECQVQGVEPKRCAICCGAHEATDCKRADFTQCGSRRRNQTRPYGSRISRLQHNTCAHNPRQRVDLAVSNQTNDDHRTEPSWLVALHISSGCTLSQKPWRPVQQASQAVKRRSRSTSGLATSRSSETATTRCGTSGGAVQ